MSLFFLKPTTAAVVYNYFLFANSFATLKDYYSSTTTSYCFRHKKNPWFANQVYTRRGSSIVHMYKITFGYGIKQGVNSFFNPLFYVSSSTQYKHYNFRTINNT